MLQQGFPMLHHTSHDYRSESGEMNGALDYGIFYVTSLLSHVTP